MKDLIADTNWPMLAKQKASALEFIAAVMTVDPRQAKDLQGLIHFIDAVQDYIVDNLLATEETIFPMRNPR